MYSETPWLGRHGLSERPTTAIVLAVLNNCRISWSVISICLSGMSALSASPRVEPAPGQAQDIHRKSLIAHVLILRMLGWRWFLAPNGDPPESPDLLIREIPELTRTQRPQL